MISAQRGISLYLQGLYSHKKNKIPGRDRIFQGLVHNNSIYLFPNYNLKLHFLYLLNVNLHTKYSSLLLDTNTSFLQSIFSL